MGTAPPSSNYAWAFRGSDYIVTWIQYPPDTTNLSLVVFDTTNLCFVPYNQQRIDAWQFGPINPSEVFDPATHRGFYVCGGFFWFNKAWQMTIPPDDGDIWQILSAGHRVPCNENIYSFTTTGILETSETMTGLQFSILPNVFTGRTSINFTLMKESPVTISVYNILGQRVALPLNCMCQPGSYNIQWKGNNLPSGVYFVRIASQEIEDIKKVIYVR
jgi:hypothetical protein